MFPSVYLQSGFIGEFDDQVKELSKYSFFSDKAIQPRLESLRRIRDLILSSNIYCDLTEEDIEKSFTMKFGDSDSLKEQIIHSGIKRDTYAEGERKLAIGRNMETVVNNDFCFFIAVSFLECQKNSDLMGKIVVNKDTLKIPFFLNHSHSSESTDESLYQIKNLTHPCSNILILDKYLFKDSKYMSKKLPNIIRVIAYFVLHNDPNKLQVDLITENTESKYSRTLSAGFKKIIGYFGEKISLHIYAPPKVLEMEASDRFILTNYALISIPHPFDRASTISCNFYPSQPPYFLNSDLNNSENKNIITGFRTLKSKLQLAKKIANRTPPKIGTVQYVWKSDETIHSIVGNS